jgi:hypothetical protein
MPCPYKPKSEGYGNDARLKDESRRPRQSQKRTNGNGWRSEDRRYEFNGNVKSGRGKQRPYQSKNNSRTSPCGLLLL